MEQDKRREELTQTALVEFFGWGSFFYALKRATNPRLLLAGLKESIRETFARG